VLTKSAIQKAIQSKELIIEPLVEDNINPNSIDVSLFKELKTYRNFILDPQVDNKTETTEISEEGKVLYPGELYLGRTNEWTEAHNLIPLLEGKSSLARLGISIHTTAGFGDVGFRGYWVLEITVTKPVFVYPNMKIGQLCFHKPEGSIDTTYSGKYQDQDTIQSCKSHIKE